MNILTAFLGSIIFWLAPYTGPSPDHQGDTLAVMYIGIGALEGCYVFSVDDMPDNLSFDKYNAKSLGVLIQSQTLTKLEVNSYCYTYRSVGWTNPYTGELESIVGDRLLNQRAGTAPVDSPCGQVTELTDPVNQRVKTTYNGRYLNDITDTWEQADPTRHTIYCRPTTEP